MLCVCHSYNLLLADAAASSVHSVTLFSILQILFTIFSGSTIRWNILKDHVKIHTLKKLSDTRCIVSFVIWYNILFQINVISKSLQFENADIVKGKEFLDKCCKFLEDYRRNGFMSSLITAKELAKKLVVEYLK